MMRFGAVTRSATRGYGQRQDVQSRIPEPAGKRIVLSGVATPCDLAARRSSATIPEILLENQVLTSHASRRSRSGALLASAAATLAAMTAYNVYRARKTEREHPPAGQFVTVDGVQLHYIEMGQGAPVVLIHGNLVTSDDFLL